MYRFGVPVVVLRVAHRINSEAGKAQRMMGEKSNGEEKNKDGRQSLEVNNTSIAGSCRLRKEKPIVVGKEDMVFSLTASSGQKNSMHVPEPEGSIKGT